MQLRTGKITGQKKQVVKVPELSVSDPMVHLKKVYHQKELQRIEESDKAHKEKVGFIKSLIKSASTGTAIEKMPKISLIYDTILDDAEFREHPKSAKFIQLVCSKASKHLVDVNTDSIMSRIDTDELLAVHKHFCCTLKQFINRDF